jgi:hypothetical protein
VFFHVTVVPTLTVKVAGEYLRLCISTVFGGIEELQAEGANMKMNIRAAAEEIANIALKFFFTVDSLIVDISIITLIISAPKRSGRWFPAARFVFSFGSIYWVM